MNDISLQYKDIHTKNKRDFLKQEMAKVAAEIQERFQDTGKVSACPCCGSFDIRDYAVKFGFEMAKCFNCLHIFTNPFPSNEALEYYYNSDFKEFENRFFIESFDKRIPIFLQRLNLIESLGAGRKILDVGSAVGIFIAANEQSGQRFDITACDMNRSACDHLQERFPDVEVLNENIIDLEKAGYDVVTLWDTIEHIPDPGELLTAVSRQLSDNGYFLFSTPNTLGFEWLVMDDDHIQLLPPGHVNLYNTENIKQLLARYGFDVQTIKTMNPALDLTYIKDTLDKAGAPQSAIGRAASQLFDVVFFDENFATIEASMRSRLMAGNMVVVARKND